MAMPNGYAVGRIAGGKSSAKTSQETEPYPHCKKTMFQLEIEIFKAQALFVLRMLSTFHKNILHQKVA